MPVQPTLFLIDGNNQMYRAYHAIRGLTGPDGRATNAVFGFVMMLRKLLADHHPTHVAASFDTEGPTFRDAIVDNYKANRAPMPDDLVAQVPWVHEACAALGVTVINHQGVEADDVIGTLARQASEAGYAVALVTGDKDFFQLVGGSVRVFNPKDDGVWFDAEGVGKKFGAPPDRVVDVLALMGDAVDNVKGVPGIGEKGARDLIAQYGSLDALLAGAASVSQKRYREALLAHADLARQSRELVTIKTDVPLDLSIETLRYNGADHPRCYSLFRSLGFRSLTTDFAPTTGTISTAINPTAVGTTAEPSTPAAAADYRLAESQADVDAAIAACRRSGIAAINLQLDGPLPMGAGTVGIALSPAAGEATYIPMGHQALDSAANLPAATVWATLAPLLADPEIEVRVHDTKSLVLVCASREIPIAARLFDTMLASYLLDSTRAPHTIESLARSYLGYTVLDSDTVFGKGTKSASPADTPATALVSFACERADLTWRLTDVLRPALRDGGLTSVYLDMEQPLVPVLAAIERAGIRVDATALRALSRRLEGEMTAVSARIFEQAGGPFNLNSPKQLGEVLFEKLNLPAARKTGKTRTASTAVDVLEELATHHEVPRLVLEWRAMQKLKGTYVDALPDLIHPTTGRVHTSFNQAVAATGRLSSSDPNLQNIPVRTELGREIRQAFVAEPGCVLISADYSQIELRVLADLAKDPALIDAFARGEDIHDRTAAAIFGVDSSRDRKDMRNTAKMVNYALLYGKTAFTLARDIGVTQQAAQAFIDAYFAGFPGVRGFIDQTLASARATGMVKTSFGRRRPVPDITSSNGQVRQAAERVAVNMPIQGTAADILKRAMIDAQRALEARPPSASGFRARMILTVHDELLFEVAREEADDVVRLVRDIMEHAASLAVPLTVDIGLGDNWNDAKH